MMAIMTIVTMIGIELATSVFSYMGRQRWQRLSDLSSVCGEGLPIFFDFCIEPDEEIMSGCNEDNYFGFPFSVRRCLKAWVV